MTGIGTNRRELTKMVDTKHPDYTIDLSLDQTTIPSQMGSNKYASQVGMTSFSHRRWEVLGSSISKQQRKSQGIVPSQMGSNQFASQEGALLLLPPHFFALSHPSLSAPTSPRGPCASASHGALWRTAAHAILEGSAARRS